MKREKLIEDDYPLVKKREKKNIAAFDEVIKYIKYNVTSRDKWNKGVFEMRRYVREMVEKEFGKKVADKYTDEELEKGWWNIE